MPDPAPIIFVIDDDASVRRAITRLVGTWGYAVASFPDAASFLDISPPTRPSCAILDLRMPALDGLELQTEMIKRGWAMPVIFLTGDGDIPTTVEAMHGGAVDFLEKPVDEEVLRDAVSRALDLSTAALRDRATTEFARQRLAALTPRELQTMRYIITGAPNKIIAHRLGITERTVKAHRHQVMEKIGARSIAELVRLAERLGVEPEAG